MLYRRVLYIPLAIMLVLMLAGCSAGTVPTIPEKPIPPEPVVSGLVEVTPQNFNFMPNKIHISGNYAFVQTDRGISVFSLSDPSNPVWKEDIEAHAGIMKSSGNYLYATGFGTLDIYEIGTDGHLTAISSVETIQLVTDFAIDNGYAFVCDYRSSMQILDISPPESAHLVNVTYTIQQVSSLTVHNGIAYLGTAEYGLQIIDVGNPASPVILNTIDFRDLIKSVYVSDEYAYLGLSGNGLVIMDVSAPKEAFVVTTVAIECRGDAVFQNDYAYVLDAGEYNDYKTTVSIIDIGNPLSPAVVDTLDIIGEHQTLLPHGEYAYGVYYKEGLQVFRIDPPGTVEAVNTIYSLSSPSDVVVSGGVACIDDAYTGLKVADIANPEAARIVDAIPMNYIDCMAIEDNFVYIGRNNELLTVSLENISECAVVSDIELPGYGYARAMAVQYGYAFISARYDEIQIVDIDPPETAGVVKLLGIETAADALAVHGEYLYTSSAYTGLSVIGFTPPDSFELVSSTPLSGDFGETKMVVGGDFIYVASSTGYYISSGGGNLSNVYTAGYLDVFDISEPSSPVKVGTLVLSNATVDMALNGNHLYLAHDDAGLELIDISVPGSENSVDGFAINGPAYRVEVDDSYAYVIGEGFHIYELGEWSAG